MDRSRILLNGTGLAEAARAWDDGYILVTAADLAAGEPAAGIEVIVTGGDRLDADLVAALPDLRLVACFSTGYAGIDVAELRRRGIALTHAAGINAHDVADHALALVLAAWHGIVPADAGVRGGTWREAMRPRRSLRGRRAGIVGLGRIGSAIADRLAAHELAVSWWGPRAKPDARFPRAQSLLELARDSDILVIATRAVAANAGQIDGEVIEALGPQAILVNISRGMLVDEPALKKALSTGRLGGAGLDVFAQEPTPSIEWAGIPGVVLTPHIAGYTVEAGAAMVEQARENVRRYFANEPLLSPVAEPVSMP